METVSSSKLVEFQKTNDVMAAFRSFEEARDIAEIRSKRTKVLHRVVRLEFDDSSIDLNAKTISEQRLGCDYIVVVER